jgi:hypothetical protein
MMEIIQIVVVIHVVDIEIVIVIPPIARPRVCVLEPIPAVLEARPLNALAAPVSRPAALYVKSVFASEAGTETIIGNAATLSARST